ncbi:hypothetical protein [Luteipulveratus mongoliensis]|uniref:Uncharacterized protein n=1 Tax=Luteipulveratus mongoliensis TaxID=571913 RepID=A0A0K1JNP6_9MICO|nr:hypothetical protein [Luteipulveratus mongoliensis]AKU18203.1 hypothetical protein VV02_24045 [Luteipulveratus mongoliensis]
MVWSSALHRGRRPMLDRLPEVERSGRVDMNARAGWLLRISRYGLSETSGAAFAAEVGRTLRSGARRLSDSQLTAAEHGDRPVGSDLVRGYELVLGMPEGALAGPLEMASRHWVGWPWQFEQDRPAPRAEVDGLVRHFFDAVPSDALTGGDWLHLARVLTPPTAALGVPPQLQSAWIAQLVDELMRSVDHAYFLRIEALSRLVAFPDTCALAEEAIMRAVSEPGAQGVVDPLSALGDSQEDEVFVRLIDLLSRATGAVRFGAALALVEPLHQDRLSPPLVQRLAVALTTLGQAEPAPGDDLRMLVRLLPEASRTELPPGLQVDGVQTVEVGADGEVARETTRYVEVVKRATLPHTKDAMLERLLSTAITNTSAADTFHALSLVAASPYRGIVSAAAGELILQGRGTRALAAGRCRLIARLATSGEEDILKQLLEHPDPMVRNAALTGYAHTPRGIPHEVDLETLMRHPTTADRALYAAGMSQHRALDRLELLSDDHTIITKWWRRHGGAVRT